MARDGSGIRYGLVAVDNFTKVADVIPITNRQPAELITGLNEIVESIGTPKQIYSDEEGVFRAVQFVRLINGNVIRYIQTSTHAPTVERFVRTFKYEVYRRLDGLNQDKREWVKHVSSISI